MKMSLAAGCFCFKGKPQIEDAFQKLKDFKILLKEDQGGYAYWADQSARSFILAKYKQTIPMKMHRGCTERLFLTTFGFHDLDYPIDWAKGLAIETAIEKIQASEGEFVSILMDREDGQIAIVNGRHGSRVLFYLQTEERFWFATNAALLMELSGQKARPDPMGVLQIVCYGHTLTPRTHTDGVYRLFPGSCLRATGKGIRQKTYWQLGYEDATEDLDPAIYADEVFEAFEQGLTRRIGLSSSGFIGLSGGLDSRLTAGAAAGRCSYFAFTFSNNIQMPDTPDVVTARQVCRRLGLEHRTGQITAGEGSAEADQIVRLCGGMIPLHHPLKSWQTIKMMAATTGFNIGGGAGDPIAGDYINSIYQIEPDWMDALLGLFARSYRRFRKKDLMRVFQRDFIEQTFGRMEQEMIQCLQNMQGPTAAHKIAAWSQVYFNSGFTFCGCGQSHPEVSGTSPHLGYKYTDKMLRLPASWLYKKNFYQYMIYRCLPSLRDIPYANTGRPLTGRLEAYQIPLKKKIARTIYKRLPYSVLAKLWERPPTKAASAVGAFSGDFRLFDQMRQIFADTPFWKEILAPEGCLKFLADYRAGRSAFNCLPIDDELFGSLASLFYWFKNTGG